MSYRQIGAEMGIPGSTVGAILNPEKAREYAERYKRNHPEKERNRQQRYRQNNPKKMREQREAAQQCHGL